MTKGGQRGTHRQLKAPAGLKTDAKPTAIVRTSLYLPRGVYEALRQVAFDERAKIHDLVMEGIEAALRRRGYPSVESLKGGYTKKGR
jgi:hypothetical protein